MKNKTRIFYGNQYVGSIKVTGKKEEPKSLYTKFIDFMFMPALVYGIIGAIFSAYQIGGIVNSTHIVEANEIVQSLKFEDIPLLVKICKAESGNRQFNSKGDVLRGAVNRSDIGFCQINEEINNDLARRLGYDIYTEQGNKDFATYLFLEKGHTPWMASHVSNLANGWSIN